MKPRPRRKPRKPVLSRDGVTVEELCRQLYSAPVVYRPCTDAERKQLDDLMATGTVVRFALRDDEKERKQDAVHMAAAAAADVYKRLSQPPNKEREFEQKVWLVLKLQLGESLDGPVDKDETLQSEKLHRRWRLVAGLHKKGWSWADSYKVASELSGVTPWAGSPRTMKEAYQLVQRVRRAVRRADAGAEQVGVGQHTGP